MQYKYPLAKPVLGMPEKENLVKCISEGWVSGGRFIAEFESRVAKLCDRKYACATSSGSTALHLALDALCVGPGDRVIVPALTYISTVNSILQCGAIPVFVDSRESDWQMDETQVRSILESEEIAAIVTVHLYGAPCDMTAIEQMRIDLEWEGVIIEDAAEAFGSGLDGRQVGSFGDVSCFSFYGNKNITTGEGGMALTDYDWIAEKMDLMRNHATEKSGGPVVKYDHVTHGYNYRISNLHASLGCAQLDRLGDIMKRKEEICSLYTETIFRPIAAGHFRKTVETWRLRRRGVKAGRWLYSLVLDNESLRDGLIAHLEAESIESRPFFTPCYSFDHVYMISGFPPKKLPVAEGLAKRGINLPTYVEMTDEDVKFISDSVLEYLLNNVTR